MTKKKMYDVTLSMTREDKSGFSGQAELLGLSLPDYFMFTAQKYAQREDFRAQTLTLTSEDGCETIEIEEEYTPCGDILWRGEDFGISFCNVLDQFISTHHHEGWSLYVVDECGFSTVILPAASRTCLRQRSPYTAWRKPIP